MNTFGLDRRKMRAAIKPCRKVGLAILAAAFLFVLTNVTSDAVIRQGYISFDLSVVNALCNASQDAIIREKGSFRLLVSFVFFETVGMSACEVSNKRSNFATFLLSAVINSPRNVHFVFTFPSLRPESSSILESAGLLPGSDAGKAIIEVLSGQMSNVELLVASIKHPAADLCHHYTVIHNKRHRQGNGFDYVLVLNDGVRGPFFNAEKMAEMV